MKFEEFVEIHKNDTPIQKLNYLMEAVDIYSHTRVQALISIRNHNHDDAMYYYDETDQMDKRMRWLYDELKAALGGTI